MTTTIEAALRRAAIRKRRVAAVRAVLFGMAAIGAWELAAVLVDRWLKTPAGVRQATTWAAAGLAAWTLVWVSRLLLVRRVDITRAAAMAERLDPLWQERLLTLVTQAAMPTDRRGSADLLRATADAVERELRQRPPVGRVTYAATRPAGVAFAVVLMLWLTASAFPWIDVPRLLGRQFRPRAGLPPVTSLRVEVQPHAKTVRQGQNLSITADVEGGDANAAIWWGPDASQVTSVPMTRTYGRRFTATLQSLQGDILYRVTAGDAASVWTTVRVIRRPGVSRLDVTCTPPGERPRTIYESDGRLRVTPGTRVVATFRVTEPVQSAKVAVGDQYIVAVAEGDGQTWRAEFVPDASASWSIELTGRRSQRGTGPPGMRIEIAVEK